MILDGVAQLADAHIKLREQFEEAEQQRLFAFMRDDEAA
jgi:hypothetical protein